MHQPAARRELRRADDLALILQTHWAGQGDFGAHYLHLALDVPPHLRGVELDPVQMRACNARLEEYRIDAVVP
jgi:putative CRISPR-associated protein (TIGR02620 family)